MAIAEKLVLGEAEFYQSCVFLKWFLEVVKKTRAYRERY